MKKYFYIPKIVYFLALSLNWVLPIKVWAKCLDPSGSPIPVGSPICDPSWGGYDRFKTIILCGERFTIDDLGCLVGGIVDILLLVAGVAAAIWIIVSGIQYTLAVGDPEKQAGAKKALVWAVIGLVIALSAYAIIKFVEAAV